MRGFRCTCCLSYVYVYTTGTYTYSTCADTNINSNIYTNKYWKTKKTHTTTIYTPVIRIIDKMIKKPVTMGMYRYIYTLTNIYYTCSKRHPTWQHKNTTQKPTTTIINTITINKPVTMGVTMGIYVCSYVYMYIYIYIHTHTHIYVFETAPHTKRTTTL